MINKEVIVFQIEDMLSNINKENLLAYGGYIGNGTAFLELMTNVLTLLKEKKEQEALPIGYQDNPYTGLPVAHCPNCGKFARQFHAVYSDEETHFCPWCGQAVKWNE